MGVGIGEIIEPRKPRKTIREVKCISDKNLLSDGSSLAYKDSEFLNMLIILLDNSFYNLTNNAHFV